MVGQFPKDDLIDGGDIRDKRSSHVDNADECSRGENKPKIKEDVESIEASDGDLLSAKVRFKLPHWPVPHSNLPRDEGLARMRTLLAKLGDPHLFLPPVIHVAGTNGKGSTVAYLKQIFMSAGYRVHIYTSPHLVEFNERIELCSSRIDDIMLGRLTEKVRIAAQDLGLDITFFEGTTAIAFCAFADVPADILIMETGMGGRFDATNILPSPVLQVITPISLDHVEYLGEDLAQIAWEKAGIIKHGVPTVIGAQTASPAIFDVLLQECENQASTPIVWDYNWSFERWYVAEQCDDLSNKAVKYPNIAKNNKLSKQNHEIIESSESIAIIEAADQLLNDAISNHELGEDIADSNKLLNAEIKDAIKDDLLRRVELKEQISNGGFAVRVDRDLATLMGLCDESIIQKCEGLMEDLGEGGLRYLCPKPGLLGVHQYVNAAISTMSALYCMGSNLWPKLTMRAICEGLQSVFWPARMQLIKSGPLAKLLPKGSELILDGAHNIGAAEMLRVSLLERDKIMKLPLYIINGRTKNRDIKGFLEFFADLSQMICCVEVKSEPRAESAKVIYEAASKMGLKSVVCQTLAEAINLCIKDAASAKDVGDERINYDYQSMQNKSVNPDYSNNYKNFDNQDTNELINSAYIANTTSSVDIANAVNIANIVKAANIANKDIVSTTNAYVVNSNTMNLNSNIIDMRDHDDGQVIIHEDMSPYFEPKNEDVIPQIPLRIVICGSLYLAADVLLEMSIK